MTGRASGYNMRTVPVRYVDKEFHFIEDQMGALS